MKKEEALIQSGLTKNESKVYLALLELHQATAVELSRKSRVHRVNVYDVLERLREKGLISSIMEGTKKIFRVANPHQLSKLLEQKAEVLNQVMPQLNQEFNLKKEKQQVYQFFGPEGVMRAYFMMLEQKAVVYGLGGSGLNRKYLKHRHQLWNKERLKQKIKMKVLYYEFTRKDKLKRWQDKTTQIRFIPDKFKTIGMIDICGNLVVNLLPLEGNIMAIVIENKVLADTYRQMFNFIWEFSKK